MSKKRAVTTDMAAEKAITATVSRAWCRTRRLGVAPGRTGRAAGSHEVGMGMVLIGLDPSTAVFGGGARR
ncbi:MAG: hypothetical protein V9G04_05665 [Nocardioides sp.]|jgi:hypothetical protein